MLYSDMESALKTAKKEIDRLTAELEQTRRELEAALGEDHGRYLVELQTELAEMKQRAEGELPSHTEMRCAVENTKLIDELAEWKDLALKNSGLAQALEAELAAVKAESAETCRKLLEDNHRIEAELAEARKLVEAMKDVAAWEVVSAAIDEGRPYGVPELREHLMALLDDPTDSGPDLSAIEQDDIVPLDAGKVE